MPLLRYFVIVGGTLLALLFIANAALPTLPLPGTLTSGSELPSVRIHTEQKLPDRVVFDTRVSLPAQAPAVPVATAQARPQVKAAAPASAAMVEISAKVRVREAFAQLPPEAEASEPKMDEMATVVLPEPKMYPAKPQVKHKRVAAAKPHNPHPLVVAQQPHFGGFATW